MTVNDLEVPLLKAGSVGRVRGGKPSASSLCLVVCTRPQERLHVSRPVDTAVVVLSDEAEDRSRLLSSP